VTPQRLKTLLAEYGTVALFTHLTIFALVFVGFSVAITAGFQPEGMASNVGTFGGAYIGTQITKPIRIAATIALTPIIARVLRRPGASKTGPAGAAPDGGAPPRDVPESKQPSRVE